MQLNRLGNKYIRFQIDMFNDVVLDGDLTVQRIKRAKAT